MFHRKNRHLGLLIFAFSAIAWVFPAQLKADATIGWIEIEGKLLETPSPFAWLSNDAPTLEAMVGAIHAAADRDDLDAVVLRLREPALTTSQIEELGEAISDLRASGKKVHLFTEIYGPAELLLGSFTDEVIMQTGGAVSLPGLHVEEMFLADALAWLGLKMDYVQIGDYKGAREQLGSSVPSKEWEENFNQLLDNLYDAMRSHLKKGRNLSDRELDRAMKDAWFASGESAIKSGLIDAELDRLDLPAHLEDAYGGDITYVTNLGPKNDSIDAAALSNPFALLDTIMSSHERELTRSTIAVLDIDGAITDGESKSKGLFGGGSVGALTIRKALKEIEGEDLVKGVIIRINSPGGSAIASESIWQGVTRLAKTKPVWVSVGSMAASGGYYIAVAGERIYLNPSSIVGSIGVVGGKMVTGGAYHKLHVNIVAHNRGPQADLFNTLEPWTDAQRSLVRDRMTETYDLFVDRVKAGRKDIDIDTTAEGRLFAGVKAIDMDLADRMGGLNVAIGDLASKLHLEKGGYDVAHFPGPKGIEEMLQKMLGGFGMSAAAPRPTDARAFLAAAVETVRQIVGPRAWPMVSSSLNAMWQMRTEPVLLTSPRLLLFR